MTKQEAITTIKHEIEKVTQKEIDELNSFSGLTYKTVKVEKELIILDSYLKLLQSKALTSIIYDNGLFYIHFKASSINIYNYERRDIKEFILKVTGFSVYIIIRFTNGEYLLLDDLIRFGFLDIDGKFKFVAI